MYFVNLNVYIKHSWRVAVMRLKVKNLISPALDTFRRFGRPYSNPVASNKL